MMAGTAGARRRVSLSCAFGSQPRDKLRHLYDKPLVSSGRNQFAFVFGLDDELHAAAGHLFDTSAECDVHPEGGGCEMAKIDFRPH